MAIAIYCTAMSDTPLTPDQQAEATAIAGRFSKDRSIEDYLASGEGLNWSSFDLDVNATYDAVHDKYTVLSGSSTLPDNTDEATWIGVQHWCLCLSQLRNALPACEWRVAVEDHVIEWDVALSAYDPGR
ncbi:hypothetical protein [Pseudomonas ovata]|uniref:hypothetical protein n=1 Tax=Pseudomonas ovata TaxID=1839709 RepID=UPI001873AEB9|nr:hypothetical protein [Pseudomonas ovata]